MRTVYWDASLDKLSLIDQTCLPADFRVLKLGSCAEVADAIRTMVVRGAPAIGITAVYGLVLAARENLTTEIAQLKAHLHTAAENLISTRPTAVNLAAMVQDALLFSDSFEGSAEDLRAALLEKANQLADLEVEINLAIARFGAELIEDGDAIIHHCNTGALATVDYGTALGVIRMAHEQGKKIHVYVDETRPRLQGSRLTAWELSQYGIPYEINVDSASGYLMRLGKVDKVLFGADRVAANGDVVNKIGTYMLALAAYDNGIPAYSVFPISTVDFDCPNGEAVRIEERDVSEVLDLAIQGKQVAPEGAQAVNYAFDVTPHRLLSGLVTERGVLYPPFFRNLAVLRQIGRFL